MKTSAITFRSISPKCYNYLRTKKGIPLPSKSTLNKRVQNLECEPGILHSVLTLMKAKADTLSTIERVTVMSFDEMCLAKNWSYDKGKDILYMPH